MIPNCSFTKILIFVIREISLFNCPLIRVPITFIKEVNFLNRLLTWALISLTKELVFLNFPLNRAVIPLTKDLVFSNCLLNKTLIPLPRELVSQLSSVSIHNSRQRLNRNNTTIIQKLTNFLQGVEHLPNIYTPELVPCCCLGSMASII
jgi:hypothetical protein